MADEIVASSARYIKLGPQGAWEKMCIAEGTLRFGHHDVPHDLAMTRDRERIKAYLVGLGLDGAAASDKARGIADFYDGDASALWVTFSDGWLWWCHAEPAVIDLGPSGPNGARLRRAKGGWSNRSAGGQELRVSALSGRLTRTAGYRRTTCRIVDAFDYLMARLNDRQSPELKAAIEAKTALEAGLVDVIRRLTWRDFEIFVDLIFASSGWRRTGAVGGTQKTIDFELELPSTGETAFVQVKSDTDTDELNAYAAALTGRPEQRMFFVYHTGPADAPPLQDVTVLGPARVAQMALSTGLVDWLLRRAA